MHFALLAPLAALLLAAAAAAEAPPLPDVALERIDGTQERLVDYRGKVLLVVNVASRCGYTPQYEGLEKLHSRYAAQGFEVLAFPSNDFGGQEPGSNREIAEFCRATYSVGFPLFAKTGVRGPDAHALYQHLSALPAPLGGPPTWNFEKFLVSRSGEVVARFAPRVEPEDEALRKRLESLLKQAPPTSFHRPHPRSPRR